MLRRRAILEALRGRRCPPRLVAGQSLILFALVLPVLVAITGLAIDAGHLYFERRHLQSIADAAAIAGAQKASFDADDPFILDDDNLVGIDDGEEQAIANALANGAAGGTAAFVTVGGSTGMQAGEVRAFVPPATAPYSGYARPDAHIEVVLERTVDHWFMYYLGMPSTTITARAVARCYTHFSSSPTLLALDVGNETAIVFDGGGQEFAIEGDVVSYGGIKANGQDESFVIDGQAIAYGSDAPGVNASGGSFGIDTGVVFSGVEDPLLACLASGECSLPAWPTTTPCVDIVTAGSLDPPLSDCDGTISVGQDQTATLPRGKYSLIEVNGNGRVTFAANEQFVITNKLDVGSQATARGSGIEVMFTGACWAINITGGANLDFDAPAASTFMNIVFYVPYGSVDLNGTAGPNAGPYDGTRQIRGTIYAAGYIDGEGEPWIPEANSHGDAPYGNKRCNNPANGSVEISGDADNSDTLVNGQIIANTIRFDGNAPLISYMDNRQFARFGVVLVNTP